MTGRRIVLTDLLPPPLEGAVCARWTVDVWTSDVPEMRAEGVEVCRSCPARPACHEWVLSIPRTERVGVIAGTDWSKPGGQPKAAK